MKNARIQNRIREGKSIVAAVVTLLFYHTVVNAQTEFKLTVNDAAVGDEFGLAVSISRERAIVGAPFDDDAGEVSGSAYVHHLPTQVVNDAWWTNEVDIEGDGYVSTAQLNWSVDLSGGSGSQNVFAAVGRKLFSDTNWTVLTTITQTISLPGTFDGAARIEGASHNMYDFRIDFYLFDGTFLTRLEPSDDEDLNDYKMEEEEEDRPQIFDFNDGTVQGWMGKAERPIGATGILFGWSDYVSYPNNFDPVGDGKGSAELWTREPKLFESDELILEYRSPDLMQSDDWQNARGMKAQILPSFQDYYSVISCDVILRVWDGVPTHSEYEVTTLFDLNFRQMYEWTDLAHSWPEDVVSQRWIKYITIKIIFQPSEYMVDGGIFLDDVQPLYETSLPTVSNTIALNGYGGSIPMAWSAPESNGKGATSGVSFEDNNRVLTDTSPGLIHPHMGSVSGNLLNGMAQLGSSDPVTPAGLIGYNIYRGTLSGGPYTQIATTTHQYYSDEPVSNDQTYYYRVTAVYEEGESDYSAEMSGRAQAGGYGIRCGWAGSVPTLDGVINADEWTTAGTVGITYPGYSGTVSLYVMNDDDYLYLAVDNQRDNSLDNGDNLGIFFDENWDRGWPPSASGEEGLLRLVWNSGSSSASFQGIHGQWPGAYQIENSITPSGVSQNMSQSSGNVQFEGRLDLDTSPLNATPGEIIGILVYTWDSGSSELGGLWPQETVRLSSITTGYGYAHAPFSYGVLKLASPESNTDVVVSIPDVTAVAGSTAQVLVNIRGYDVNQILAGSVTFNYDQNVISSPSVSAGDLLDTVISFTGTPGQVMLSFARATPLSGAGTLAVVTFEVVGAPGTSTLLDLTVSSFNEGTITATFEDGLLTVSNNVVVSGKVTYYSDATKRMANVTVNATGDVAETMITGADGSYSLEMSGGLSCTLTPNYQVSESQKINAISAFDAAPILQYTAGFPPENIIGGPIEGARFLAADVTGNGTVSAFDATPILQFTAGFPKEQMAESELGLTLFDPSSKQFSNVTTDQENQDFEGVIRGDVTGNFTPTTTSQAVLASLPEERGFDLNNIASKKERAQIITKVTDQSNKAFAQGVIVSIPAGLGAETGSSVEVSVSVSGVEVNQILAGSVSLSYDPGVLSEPSVTVGELLGSVTANTLVSGEVRFSFAEAVPLSGDGRLVAVIFNVVGLEGSSTVLDLTEASFNEGSITAILYDGSLTVTGGVPGAVEETKLTASDGSAGDRFGWSVSIDGDYAIVSARGDDDNGDDSGSAYIFKRNGTSWDEQAKLIASDGDGGDQFGESVSLDGEYAIAGAWLDDDNSSNSGSAHIFKRNGTAWDEQTKLTVSDGSFLFGVSVSMDGDYTIVGAAFNLGSAYVFKRNGSDWVEQAKLTASDGSSGDRFGESVSLDGDYAVVGVWGDDDNGEDSGSAYIFKRNGTSWDEQAKLTASDGSAGDRFGWSVSIDGDYAIVAARGDDDSGEDSGSAYIFKRNGTSWDEQAKLTASDGRTSDVFGYSVSIAGDFAIVGAERDDDHGSGSGSAYIFKRNGTSWDEHAKLTASDGDTDDRFGTSVSLDGGFALVGAVLDDDKGADSGSAYVYDLSVVGVIRGDVNFDGIVNVTDLISVINFILGLSTPTDQQFAAADVNGDAALTVSDLIGIINVILGIG